MIIFLLIWSILPCCLYTQATNFSSRSESKHFRPPPSLRCLLDFSEIFFFEILPPFSSETFVQRCFVKKVFLEISQNSQENTCARDSFLIKLRAETCNFIKKESLAQVFSCEFCEISKSTFFYRTPPVAASISYTFIFYAKFLCC